MTTFFSYLNWTDQGVRILADSPARVQAARTVAIQGNVRTTTVRGFTEDEYLGIVADLP